MVTIKIVDSPSNDRYIISPDSNKLGRMYDDNAETIKVVFPNNEINSKCTMIVKDSLGNGIDLIDFKNNEIKQVRNNLSKYDKVVIGFVFTKENYVKYTSYKTFFFEPSMHPNDFAITKPQFKGYCFEALSNFVANIKQNGNVVEFLNIYNEIVGNINIENNGTILEESDPTVPSHVKDITQEDINKWNNGGDKTEIQNQINQLNTNKAEVSYVNSEVARVENIAKGANQAVSFGNYSTMITTFNALAKDTYNVGQNVMIVTLNVPDLWISGIEETNTPYTYTSDEDFVNQLSTNGTIQVGYYKLSALETQKVNLTEYAKKTEVANFETELLEDGSYSLTITTGE